MPLKPSLILSIPTVSVTFQNFTTEVHNWIITDLGNGQVVFSGSLKDRDDPDPTTSKTTCTLVSDGVLGNAEYQKDTDPQPTKALQLTDGQTVNMN